MAAEFDDTEQRGRRDFMAQAAGTLVGIGSAVALWPLIDQMNPHNGTPPPETREVGLHLVQPGHTISVVWRGKPVFIRHRTREEVQLARSTPLSSLPDPFARNEALPARAPATDANRTQEGHENWLVVVGLCTHLGCVLTTQEPAETANTGEGWLCRCHAARFDLSGRVRSGPASTNLAVPPYQFLTPTKIRIG